MISDIIEIENVISEDFQNEIYNKLFLDETFPWLRLPNVVQNRDGSYITDNSHTLTYVFRQYQYLHIDNEQNSFFEPLMREACAKINFTVNNYMYGTIYNRIANENFTGHNAFHSDNDLPHLVCLYYVNDSTGNTLISSITTDDMDVQTMNGLDNKSIIKEITPKKGKCVLFNGKHYHASGNPIEGNRCIINFNVN
jgi:hypothetical protein